MPTFILHGGKEEIPSPMNDGFYAELAKATPHNGVCLLAYFASDNVTWAKKFERDSARIYQNASNKDITCKCASVKNFRDEVKNADVIYFSGGNSQRQMQVSKQFANVFKEDKVFAGSSSGAYLMRQKFYTARVNGFLEGCGVLPFHILAHADNETHTHFEGYLKPLAAKETPLLKLREGEFITLEYN